MNSIGLWLVLAVAGCAVPPIATLDRSHPASPQAAEAPDPAVFQALAPEPAETRAETPAPPDSAEESKLPEVSGTVRVKKCQSGFHLRRLDANSTEIDYEMSLDPAGLLPKWAGSYVAKHVPFKTLVALEETAQATRGKYEAVVQRWSGATF